MILASFKGVEDDVGVATDTEERGMFWVGVGVVILWVSCFEVISARLASLESTEAVSLRPWLDKYSYKKVDFSYL